MSQYTCTASVEMQKVGVDPDYDEWDHYDKQATKELFEMVGWSNQYNGIVTKMTKDNANPYAIQIARAGGQLVSEAERQKIVSEDKTVWFWNVMEKAIFFHNDQAVEALLQKGVHPVPTNGNPPLLKQAVIAHSMSMECDRDNAARVLKHLIDHAFLTSAKNRCLPFSIRPVAHHDDVQMAQQEGRGCRTGGNGSTPAPADSSPVAAASS